VEKIRFRLLTMAASHYCEKARWALDRAGVGYDERRYLPLAHMIPVWLSGAGHMVPVLRDQKTTVADSTAIIRHIDTLVPDDRRLFPTDPGARAEVEKWEELFDQRLGPATRRWAYFHLLPEREIILRTLRRTVGRLTGLILPLLFPVVRRLIQRGYRINTDSAARSFECIQEVFQQVNALLQDGRGYLAGDRFSAADLGFAALAAPALYPAEAGATMPAVDELPPTMARAVNDLRASPAGQFALRMYRQHRR
jgi:glutathione S-transferase